MPQITTQELVSIIMPAYNAEKTIIDSINSVLQQDFKSFNLYVINDASQDKTKEIILSFNDSRIIYLENDKNSGVAESRNKGLKMQMVSILHFWIVMISGYLINYLHN